MVVKIAIIAIMEQLYAQGVPVYHDSTLTSYNL